MESVAHAACLYLKEREENGNVMHVFAFLWTNEFADCTCYCYFHILLLLYIIVVYLLHFELYDLMVCILKW